jgi:hypothetical protein
MINCTVDDKNLHTHPNNDTIMPQRSSAKHGCWRWAVLDGKGPLLWLKGGMLWLKGGMLWLKGGMLWLKGGVLWLWEACWG